MIVLFFILFFVLPVQTVTLTARELPDEFLYNISGENRKGSLIAPVILNDEQDVYPLGLYLEILEDPSCKLTIDEIVSSEFENKFVPNHVEVPNFGHTNSAYWVRFRIINETRQSENWRLKLGFANMQYIDLYLQRPDNKGYTHKKTGTYLPFNTRDIPYPSFVFKMPLENGAGQTIYMRFLSGASMTLPLTLLSAEAFTQKSQKEQLIAGLFYGILFLIFGYSLVVFLLLREKSYLYYFLSVAGFILFHASYDGFASQYLWPDHAWWNHFAFIFLNTLVIFFALKFASVFLQTKNLFPVCHKIIIAWLVLCGMVVLMIPFFRYGIVIITAEVLSILCFLTILVAGIVIWRKKYRPARYFMIAVLTFLVSGSILEMVRLGVLPSNTFTEHAYQVGIVILVFLLSLALADRINILKKEKDKLVLEQTENLEEEVDRRTKALKESEKKYRNVVERASDVIIIIQDYKIKYTNRKIVDILGYSYKEFVNENFTEFVHPDEREKLLTRYKQRIAGEKMENYYETTLLHRDGHQLNVIISGGLIDYDGKPADLVIVHDITGRKKIEKALKRSEEKYRSFFKTSTGCVYITTKEGEWIDMSDGAPGFFGYESKEELQKVNIRELYVNESDREKDILEIEKKGTVKDALFNLRRKDGSIISALISSVAIKDEDGNVVAFQGSIRDITIQQQAEKSLKETKKYLQELNTSKDKFFSIISHDLRSPFNSILGFSELLWKNTDDFSKPEIKKIAADIYKTGNETIDLLDNLLEWSRSQTGRLEIDPENFSLKEVVDDTIDLLNENAKRKSITMLNEIPGHTTIFADKNMIGTVMRNLLSNAIKFTHNGNVRIESRDVDNFVEVTVTDTGVGIKSENIERLFRLETEFSTRGTANEKGTGLGLVLCKEFIEKNHGEIDVKSKEGTGTSFILKLPNTKN